jgi:cytoskeleton protein RodZ
MSVVDSMTDTPANPPISTPEVELSTLSRASDAASNGVAGAMLRAARQQQGLHIAALAAAIKVSPAKLESLESGRYHELLDITFSRALAQTVCRVLKIDPAPVLAQMPGAPPDALGRVDGGLNMPYRERPGRVMSADWAPWRHPVLWLVAMLLIAAAAFVLVPSSVVRDLALPGSIDAVPVMPPGGAAVGLDGAALPSADAATAMSAAASGVLGAAGAGVAPSTGLATAVLEASQPSPLVSSASTGAASAVVVGATLALRALQATWVQAIDGNGQTLMARVVPAGETVELTAQPPVRLRIGNASGTELSFRGQRVDLRSASRDNIANITLP